MSRVRHPHLAELLARADAVCASIEKLVQPLDSDALRRRPGEGRWSVSEILDHLSIVDEPYESRIADALDRGAASDEPYRPRWMQRKFIAMAGPQGRPVRAPKAFRPAPSSGSSPASNDALPRFLTHAARLRDLILRADGRSLNAPRFASPITRLLRFTPGEALTLLIAHTERHRDQIERLVTTEPSGDQ